MEYQLRIPTAADTETVVQLHVESWRETYGHLLPESFFNDELVEQRRRMWTDNLRSIPPAWDMQVAEAEGEMVGFALAGPASGQSPSARELHLIYVLRAHQGTQLGQQLLDSTLGADPGILWVEKTNERAKAFYRRNGFELDGTEEADEQNPVFVDVRMVR
ncbi:GNAT family N-acetyltransferase [Arthrobacter sp. B2a2-09]|uniref:GNAT family N-acetyltransferase n=1 Tax=Arthrobacter sp. B2a2-09 TaxID=2952822 RepID=UPI0022CD5F38|nr:GNAT family N-acetyltransferase [Arthrobacter sp. B2a2-09]MCZ9881733.1 GNAT family N-acetyltransferase [Arthrobacter sp. B2a2-09]